MEIFLFYYKFCSLKATDHTYYGLTGPTAFAGWCENSQKVCKSLASNWWFTEIFTCPPNLPWGLSWQQTHCNCGLFLNSLTPESDTCIISPDIFTPKSSIKVMRIRRDMCKIKKNLSYWANSLCKYHRKCIAEKLQMEVRMEMVIF